MDDVKIDKFDKITRTVEFIIAYFIVTFSCIFALNDLYIWYLEGIGKKIDLPLLNEVIPGDLFMTILYVGISVVFAYVFSRLMKKYVW